MPQWQEILQLFDSPKCGHCIRQLQFDQRYVLLISNFVWIFAAKNCSAAFYADIENLN